MPNLDGGHYFLTVLSPVLAVPVRRQDGSITSPTAMLREALASLPTAVQSKVCSDGGHHSPFARCHRTHFARFVVIDQPAFNGRDNGNAIIQSIQKVDLLVPGPVDTLTRAWLLLAIDFDAADEPDGGLESYLIGLWNVMAEELREVFRFCHGFDQVKSGDDFARYIKKCQVETTMPFNDYWITPLNLPTLSLGNLAVLAIAVLAATVLALWLGSRWIGLGTGVVLAAIPIGIAAGIWALYRLVARRSGRQFPTSPGSDLRTILKALHLQQAFTRFAIANQGASPAALKTALGDFLKQERPDDLLNATQAPGVIQS